MGKPARALGGRCPGLRRGRRASKGPLTEDPPPGECFLLPKNGEKNILIIKPMEIISTHLARLGSVLLIATAGSAPAADLLLQKVAPLTVEQAPRYPQNLARIDLGAQAQATPQSDTGKILSGDPKATYELNSGESTLLISLGKIEHIDSIAFLNSGAQGTVAIATANANLSATGSQWRDAGRRGLGNGALNAKVGPTEAKYVKLTFNIQQPGRLSGIGVFGAPGVADFTMPRPRRAIEGEIAQVNYNLADLHTKARALYVSSGDDLKLANNMIDDQAVTSYTFAANDSTPTAIIDLGREMSLRRISVLSTASAGTANFYLLSALPVGGREATAETKPAGAPSGSAVLEGTPAANVPDTLRLDEGAVAGLKSVGSASADASGSVAVDFPETSGRYVMVKWTRSSSDNFSVAEIAAFGRATTNMLFAANRAIDRSDKNVGDGKDGKDAKDFKDIPAEGPEAPAEGPPPALPPQPPFVFIPQIVPTSP